MKIVSIASQKGGAGKTTLAIHLAVAAERVGQTAAIIDLDPQASAAGWGDTRTEGTPAIVSVAPARLMPALQAARDTGADLVLIDTAPHAEGAALAAAREADVVLIPCRAGILDLRAIGATADLVRIAGKPAYVVLNAVPPGATRLIADARAAVAVHGLEISPAIIGQRAALAHSLTSGLTAQEFEPKGKATAEISQLYEWLVDQISSTAKLQRSKAPDHQDSNAATQRRGSEQDSPAEPRGSHASRGRESASRSAARRSIQRG